jgi:anti-anti-sigma regulatory factor
MIRSEGNKIIFEGNLRSETRAALVCIFQLIQKLGYRDVTLDFSAVKYIDADLMLPLSSYAGYYRMNQIDFSLVEPTDPKLRRLFTNTNWAHFIDPQKYARNEQRRSNNLPALQFLDGDAQHNV